MPHFHINFAAGLCFSALKALIIAMSSLSETGGEWHPGEKKRKIVSNIGGYKDEITDYDARI